MIQKYYYLLNFLATMNNFSTPIWRALSIMAIARIILPYFLLFYYLCSNYMSFFESGKSC